jgi:serine/threonine protein kinase
MTLPPPPESSPVSTSSRGPRLGGSIFPASREAPIELGRYAVVSMLGKGGMGVVYEAVDRERGQVVALKTLRSLDPHGLRRLKAEFRSVADIVHRNLVLLHELVADGDDTFFVMDYVAGENFLDHVRGKRTSPREKSRAEPLAATVPEPVVRTERTDDDDVAPPLDPSRFDRLGETIIQVVCGLSALHKAGKFHRDVKPTNVRVTAQGRAVVLDFGLVKGEVGLDLYGPTAGTPAYMAPEQVLGQPVSAATDLYAVGVMMYEVLVGRRPFAGSPLFVLASKVNAMPPRPRSYAPWLPEHLDELCMDLLATAPEARPSAAEVVRRLGGDPDALATGTGEGLARSEVSSSQERNGPVSAPPVMSSTSPFLPQGDSAQDARPPSSVSPGPLSSSQSATALSLVGRERELALLAEAYADVKRGNTVAVAVSGHSGVGKSSIVRAFLDGLRASGEATLLEGRCYERESVRFKAFDEVVDALGQQLRFVPWQERALIVPDGIGELSRIFPVLADLAIAAGARPDDRNVEPVELQRRAFACLKGDPRPPLVAEADRRLHRRPPVEATRTAAGCSSSSCLHPSDHRSCSSPRSVAKRWRRARARGATHPDLRDRIRDLHVGPLSFQARATSRGALRDGRSPTLRSRSSRPSRASPTATRLRRRARAARLCRWRGRRLALRGGRRAALRPLGTGAANPRGGRRRGDAPSSKGSSRRPPASRTTRGARHRHASCPRARTNPRGPPTGHDRDLPRSHS